MSDEYFVTFEARQTARITVKVESADDAQEQAKQKWYDDGLEGRWVQGDPKITGVKLKPTLKGKNKYGS